MGPPAFCLFCCNNRWMFEFRSVVYGSIFIFCLWKLYCGAILMRSDQLPHATPTINRIRTVPLRSVRIKSRSGSHPWIQQQQITYVCDATTLSAPSSSALSVERDNWFRWRIRICFIPTESNVTYNNKCEVTFSSHSMCAMLSCHSAHISQPYLKYSSPIHHHTFSCKTIFNRYKSLCEK